MSKSGRPAATEDVVERMGELTRRMMGHIEVRVAELELTLPQAMLLHSLDQPMPMREVAGRLHCDASNVTGIVDRLEVRGLVARRGRPGDRRVKELALTASGAETRTRVEAVLDTMPGVSNLSPTDLRALRDLLDRALA
ncbi:MAG TPA: MarR family transcriptional regulator [Candidatus Solibacter sp.]|jgi:DNA-binding MarR family transcriptional regulator|nr:MarR family transcriptional regulator [Candidatus Solibacter sp.]